MEKYTGNTIAWSAPVPYGSLPGLEMDSRLIITPGYPTTRIIPKNTKFHPAYT